MLRTPLRGALMGAALTTVLAVGLLQAPGQAAPDDATGSDRSRRAAEPAYRDARLPVDASGSPTCWAG